MRNKIIKFTHAFTSIYQFMKGLFQAAFFFKHGTQGIIAN